MTGDAAGLELLWCVFPDAASAEAAAHDVVAKGLAACANILAPVRSVYRWEGTVEQAEEVPLLCKTGAGQGAVLAARLTELHSYELPAISWWRADCPAPLSRWAARR